MRKEGDGAHKTKNPLSRPDAGFMSGDAVLAVVLRPESMSPLDAAWLRGFLCGLSCDMDTRVDAKPFRVWVRPSNAKSR